jgi:glutamine cyclotransferase
MSALCPRFRQLSFGLVLLLASLGSAETTAPVADYKVVAKFPHSTSSYTEGFFYRDGLFYESIGMIGRSAVLAINPQTGTIAQRRGLPNEYFGEGIVDWGANLYQWTWKSHICFVYDRFSLRPIRQFTYTGEGWGMTRTTNELITSDGSATLRFRNPDTFQETRHILVKDGAKFVGQLNSSSSSKAKSSPTSGTPIGSRVSPRGTATSSAGLTSPVFCPLTRKSTPSPSSTGSHMTRSTTGFLSPANNGPQSSR